jgi:outer membrane lipoprotein-sorting protein
VAIGVQRVELRATMRYLNPNTVIVASPPSSKSVTPVILAIVVLFPFSLAFAQQNNQSAGADLLAFIVQGMEKAQSGIQLPVRITREYQVGSANDLSDVVAAVDFTPPGRYVIEKHDGSGRAEQVVKRLLQHEIEVQGSVQKSQSKAFTNDNYVFGYITTGMLDGHVCYVLQITPKRQQVELVSGRAWIDQQSFLIRRIEGTLAKSPSWWVRSVHVTVTFNNFHEGWAQTSMKAVADIRCLGEREMTSQTLSIETPPLAAQNATQTMDRGDDGQAAQ